MQPKPAGGGLAALLGQSGAQASPTSNLPPLPGGAQPTGQGGLVPLSVRQNNPLNLVDPKSGQIRTYATPEEGLKAGLEDLELKLSGKSAAYKSRFGTAPVTPERLTETWSPSNAPGNTKEATSNYAKIIAKQLGINPGDPIPNTPQAKRIVAQTMANFEAGRIVQLPWEKLGLPTTVAAR